MSTKKQAGSVAWTAPDDAPALSADMLDRAETFEGNVFVGRGRGRPKTGVAREQISVRLDADVLAKLREAGPGWQSQINGILRRALRLSAKAAKQVARLRRRLGV